MGALCCAAAISITLVSGVSEGQGGRATGDQAGGVESSLKGASFQMHFDVPGTSLLLNSASL